MVEAVRRGYDFEVVREEGKSAKSIQGRDKLVEALDLLDKHKADVLMAVRMDRLSRDVGDVAALMRRSKRKGWGIILSGERIDTTPDGEFRTHLDAALAQRERGMIGLRTREGMAQRKAEGQHMGRRIAAEFLPTYRRVLAMHAVGEGLNAIARILNDEGVTTARGKTMARIDSPCHRHERDREEPGRLARYSQGQPPPVSFRESHPGGKCGHRADEPAEGEEPMDEQSFDRVLLTQAQVGAPIDLMASIVRAKGDGNSAHVAVETVFTDDAHPFDDLKLNKVAVRRLDGPNYVVLELTDSDGLWAAAAFTTEHEGVFHIASGQPRTDKRWDKLERALTGQRAVSRCFLNHADFLAIATGLEQSSPIFVSRVTARKTEDHSSISRGFSQSRPTPQQAVDDIEDQSGVVRTMSMQSEDVSLQIRRIAGATFYGGQPRYFVNNVLRPLASSASARRQLVSNRARQGVDEELHALNIDLSEELFSTREDTGVLLDVVAQMPHTEVAVFHRNPYLHFALFDSRDGSNFDVVVTEANSIQIYPGYRASQDAVARVAQALGERFGASSIDNPPQRERISIEELIG